MAPYITNILCSTFILYLYIIYCHWSLFAGYLQLSTRNKPCFRGIQCCSYSVVTIVCALLLLLLLLWTYKSKCMLNPPSGTTLLKVTAPNKVFLNITLFCVQFIQKLSCCDEEMLDGRKHFRLRLIILCFISFRPSLFGLRRWIPPPPPPPSSSVFPAKFCRRRIRKEACTAANNYSIQFMESVSSFVN
jgi:hypothetical protein